MKLKTFILFLVFIIFFSGLLTYIGYNFFIVKKKYKYEMHLQVSDYLGFNAQTDKIYFGTVLKGGKGVRKVVVFNSYNYPLLVTIKTTGELAKFVTVSKNNFILNPFTNDTIKFYAETSKDTQFGNYTATSEIVFKRV